MSLGTLAIRGGTPARERPFPAYVVMDEAEQEAARRVVESGILSRFIGAWHPDFYGGPEVRAFEEEWADICGTRHGVSVNSCTSGLIAAVGAAGVGPGDEVVVSPYSMSISATAPLVFNAVPIFADIDPNDYCISADTIRPVITPRTKAIIVVHIFGQVADMGPIMKLAKEHNLTVIEDCAQVPFAHYYGHHAGTLGDMGVFSLNYHKHMHTGEGGLVITDDDGLAERVQLIRNHAESVVEDKGTSDIINMIGFNFRLGELEAAIGREQLKKGLDLTEQRIENVLYLEEQLQDLDGLSMPWVREDSRHVYYKHTLSYDSKKTDVDRPTLMKALRAELPVTRLREGEGPLIAPGYVKPIYLLPIFNKKVGYGDKKCPFHCPHYEGDAVYEPGLCPNAERAHFETVITHELMRPGMQRTDLDDVASAFRKVWDNLYLLEYS